jgi:hypothetical protein
MRGDPRDSAASGVRVMGVVVEDFAPRHPQHLRSSILEPEAVWNRLQPRLGSAAKHRLITEGGAGGMMRLW